MAQLGKPSKPNFRVHSLTMGAPLCPDTGYNILSRYDMPMHEYMSKFVNLLEHAYGLSSTCIPVASYWPLPSLRVL